MKNKSKTISTRVVGVFVFAVVVDKTSDIDGWSEFVLLDSTYASDVVGIMFFVCGFLPPGSYFFALEVEVSCCTWLVS